MKRKLLKIWLLLLTLLVTTIIQAQTAFLDEGFESGIPATWSTNMTSGSTNWTAVTSATTPSAAATNGGTKWVKFYSSTDGNQSQLISPSVDLSTANGNVTLSFLHCMAAWGSDQDSLGVYYRTSTAGAWKALKGYTTSQTTWVQRTITLPSAALTATTQIMFQATAFYGYGVHIDNVKLEDDPLCAKPINLAISQLSQTSALLQWSMGGGAINSDFILYVNGSSVGTITSSDNTYLLSGLSVNTDYSVMLKTDCNSISKGQSTVSDPVSFKTLCASTAIPYTENFDALTSGLPACWQKGGSSTTVPTVQTTTRYGTSGAALKLVSTASTDAYVVSIPLNEAANNLEISFKVYGAVKQKLSVGIIEDITDVSTAELVFNDSLSVANTWTEYVVSTQGVSYTASGLSLIFYSPSGSANTIYIDDIQVTTLPTCLRVKNLSYSQVGADSAVLNWTDQSSVTSWLVRYITGTDTATVVANAKPFTLTGLTANTTYKVDVRAICSVSDTSVYSNFPVTFKTHCSEVVVSDGTVYSESFDTYGTGTTAFPTCWFKVTANGSYPYISTTNASSPGALYFSSNVLTATTQFDVPANTLRVRFKLRGAYQLVVGAMSDVTNASTFVPVDTITGTSSFASYEVLLNKYTGVGQYIAFKTLSSATLYVDDVMVDLIPSCPKPKKLTLGTVTASSANISWTPNGTETSWKLIIKTGTVVDSVVVNGTPNYTISNLTSNTNYSDTISITALCSPTDSSEVYQSTVAFKTLCSTSSIPYTENFDSYTSGTSTQPDCWSFINRASGTTTPYAYVYTSTSYAVNQNCLYLGNTDSKVMFAVLPEFTDSIKKLVLNFTYRNGGTSTYYQDLIVGVMTDKSDASTFIPVYTCPKSTNKVPVEIYFKQAGLSDGVYYIAFKSVGGTGTSTYNLGIDNVSVDYLPSCYKPQDVTVKTLASDSVSILLTDTINTTWEVEYGPLGFALGSGTVIAVTDSLFSINGLTPETNYMVYVRAACSVSDFSAYDSVSFTTPCAPFVVTDTTPFFEGFESDYTDQTAIGGCWSQQAISGSSSWTANSTLTDYNRTPRTGSFNAYLRYSNTNWLFYPVSLQANQNYELSVYARQDGATATNSNITLAVGAVASEVGMTNKFVTDRGIVNGDYQLIDGVFTVPSAGIYYIGIKGYMNGSPRYISLDDITLRELACLKPTNMTISTLSDTTATITWTGSSDSWDLKVDTALITNPETAVPSVFSGNVATNSYTLTGLSENTTYYYYLKAHCASKESDWTLVDSLTTECAALALPYSEGFEAVATSKTDCWQVKGTGTAALSTTYKYSGSRSIQCTNVMAVSPRFNVNTLVGYQVSGYAYSATDSVSVNVGIIVNPQDINTAEIIGSVLLPKKNTWTPFTIYFDILSDPDYVDFVNAKYVVFSVSNNAIYFDDLEFAVKPTCPRPYDLATTNVTDSSATISWTGFAETAWQVQVTKNNVVVVDSLVTTPTVTISHLTANTAYQYAVRAICAVADSSLWISNAFTTQCGSIVLPYSETFNSYTVNGTIGAPDCWSFVNRIADGTTTYPMVYINNSSTYAVSGNSLYFRSKASEAVYAVMPVLKDSIKSVGISFYYKNEGTSTSNGTLSLGLMTDPTDSTTFTQVLACPIQNTSMQLVEYEFKNVTLANDVYYIAFKYMGGTSNNYYLGIDNVNLFKVSNCIKPTAINTANPTLNSIQVIVTDTINAAWDIAVGVSGFNPDTLSAVSYTTSDTTVVSGLNHSSIYDVYVRANCGTEQSNWVGPVSFKTTCAAITSFPFVEGFEATTFPPNCWTNVHTAGSATTLWSRSTTTTYVHSGLGAAYLGYQASGNKVVLATPELVIPTANTHELSFWMRRYNSSSYSGERLNVWVNSTPDTIGATKLKFIEGSVTREPVETGGAGYYNYTAYIPTAGNVYVIFDMQWKSGLAVALDDISITEQTCIKPSALAVDQIGLTDARLIITPLQVSNWDVAVCTGSQVPDDHIVQTNVALDTILLTGLNHSTSYQVYVRTNCGLEVSAWSKAVSFQTSCAILSIPFAENFSTLTAGIPACWDNTQGTTTTATSRFNYYLESATSNVCLRFNSYSNSSGYTNYLKTPQIAFAADEETVLSFKYKNPTGGNYSVFLSTDGGLTYVDTISTGLSATSWTTMTYIMPVFTTATNLQIVFKGTSNYGSGDAYLYLDEINLYDRPTCYVPENITLSNLKDTAVTVTWVAGPDSQSYELEVTSVNGVDTVSTVVKTATLTGLIPNTAYSLKVRALCLPLDTTSWSSAITFTTSQVPPVLPYIYGFEDATENGNWSIVNGTQTNKWIISDKDSAAVYEGDKALYVSNNDSANAYTITSASTVWAYRTLALESGTYSVDFAWKGQGQTTNDYLRVFLAPALNSAVSAGSLVVGSKTISSTVIPDGWIALGGVLNQQATWQTYTGVVDITNAGNYNLMILWSNNATVGTQAPAAIDSISVVKLACSLVKQVAVDPADSSAVLTFVDTDNSSGEWEYELINLVTPDTLTVLIVQDSVTLANLTPNTNYKVRVRAKCTTTLYSPWSAYVTFVTDKTPATTPYVYGFEDVTENNDWTLVNGSQTNKWAIGSAEALTGSKALYVSADNGTTSGYTITSTSTVWAYRTFNLTAGMYDASFFYKSGGEGTTTLYDYMRVFIAPASDVPTAGSRVIGSTTIDATDKPTSWIELAPSALLLQTDWTQVSSEFAVSADGLYNVVLLWRNDGSAGTQPGACVDDVNIQKLTCYAPTVVASGITATSATLSWASTGSTTYKIVVKDAGQNIVCDSIVTDTSFVLNGLSASSTYTVVASSDCNLTRVSNSSFSTLCGAVSAPFYQDFSTLTAGIPTCWDNTQGTTTTDTYRFNYYLESATSNVCLRFNSFNNSDGNTNYLKTPEIALGANEALNLSFKYKNPTGDDFSVYISTDGGLTYSNTVATGLTGVTSWTTLNYALPQFATPTNIQVIFKGTSNYGYGDAYIYLDDVRIVCVGEREIHAEVCQGMPYVGNGLSLTAAQTNTPGEHTYTTYTQAATAAACDTTYTIKLMVNPTVNVLFQDTICQGQSYHNHGFDINNPTIGANLFVHAGTSASGCDSITTLKLYVSLLSVIVRDSICEGTPYLFGNQSLTASGVYTDTVVNSVGCDSVTTLRLYVVPSEQHLYDTICQGSSYLFYGTTYTTTGVYTHATTGVLGCPVLDKLHLTVLPNEIVLNETICRGQTYFFKNKDLSESGVYRDTSIYVGSACDSVTVLTLTVIEPDTMILSDYVCQGEALYNYGYLGLEIANDTIIYQHLQNEFGCDSVLQVAVAVIEPVYVQTTVNIQPGDTYNFAGNTYSVAGDYVGYFKTTDFGCDSIVTLKLTIGTGLNFVEGQSLTMVPNPVLTHQTVTVNYDFTAADKDGLVVELINSVGEVIYASSNPTQYPIQVSGFDVSGFYVVRVTTGTHKVFHGKVIVK